MSGISAVQNFQINQYRQQASPIGTDTRANTPQATQSQKQYSDKKAAKYFGGALLAITALVGGFYAHDGIQVMKNGKKLSKLMPKESFDELKKHLSNYYLQDKAIIISQVKLKKDLNKINKIEVQDLIRKIANEKNIIKKKDQLYPPIFDLFDIPLIFAW